MVTSVKTAHNVLDVILKYVPDDQIDNLINELKDVQGNKSYQDTVKLIEKIRKSS